MSLNDEKEISINSDDPSIPKTAKKLCFKTDFIRGFNVKVSNVSDWMDYREAGSFTSIITQDN